MFRDTVPFPTSGFLFPGPEFVVGTSGTPINIGAGPNGVLPTVLGNDLYARSYDLGGPETMHTAVVSVAVPAAKAGEITASLSGEVITVNAVGGFRGTTYFDYRVHHTSGEDGTARVYVLFR